MNETITKVCPFCKTEITENGDVITCGACEMPHHKTCWEENKGCSTLGCSIQNSTVNEDNNTQTQEARCKRCQALLSQDQQYCRECGQPAKILCAYCRTELSEGQMFCRACGQRTDLQAGDTSTSQINQFNDQPMKNKSKATPIIIIASVLAGILIVVFSFFGVSQYQQMQFHNKLQTTWNTFDDDTLLTLEFSKNKIDYSAHFSLIGTQNISMIPYEVINTHSIKVYGNIVEVEFSDGSKGSNIVTFRPSFINSDSYLICIED